MIDFSNEIIIKSASRHEVILDRTADLTNASLLWLSSQLAEVTESVSK